MSLSDYRTRTSIFGLLFICMAVAVSAGCGGPAHEPPQNTVKGTVTLDGQPVEKGVISFESPADVAAGVAGNADIVNGQYETTTTIGAKTVRISAQVAAGEPDATGMAPMKETIPPKYNTQSKLTEEIKEGENVINFDLSN